MKSINILIVEDELILAKSLARKLKRCGHTVIDIVSSGLKAIEKVSHTNVDLILMDIVLQGDLDGIATSQKIQENHQIPIIYLSSYSDRETLKRARETKPKGYIVKPYKLEDLKATIEAALSHSDPLKSNLKHIARKTKLATFKVKQIARQNLNLPSLSDRDRQLKRAKYRERLPQLSPEDARIVSTLEQEGVYVTSLPELTLPHTKRLLKEMMVLHPHLYTLSNLKNWREGIPGLRKFLHTEILLWGLEERLLNIVENYIGLPLLFHGVDLRRDSADAPLTDARHWHRDIDDERMVKVIVYLNNVGKTGGPYEYIPRTFTQHLTDALNYKSGFVSDEAISAIIPPEQWQTCAAKAGTIIITDPCNVFHRAKPAKRNRYSITFGYTSRIPKLFLSEFQLSPIEWNRITPQLSKRQIACLRRSKL
ncbi:MAG: response regulator [Pleurocapsa sp. MO_226.B13]|nr:response regulator [Pleurocapsa sp. MO_226.B13]